MSEPLKSDAASSSNINYMEFMNISCNNNITGFALGGEVLAISGDEKIREEVIQWLSGGVSIDHDNDTQKVWYNDRVCDDAHPHTSATYLELVHTDCLYDDMTVEEVLHCANAVRTPMWDESPSLISDVIESLELEPLLTTYVKNLTLAHRYVVLLAAEVVTKKEVLFLNDPVVGLSLSDSNDVLRSISIVARIFRKVVVVTVTHFCQNYLVDFFDRLLLVSSTGVVYFGRAADANKVFNDHYSLDFGNSYSELLIGLLEKKLIADDEPTSLWNEDELRQARCTEGNYSMRTLPMKREQSFSPFNTATETPHVGHVKKHKHHGTSVEQHLRYYLRTVWWLFWRAWVVRARNRSQIISQILYGGVAPAGGLSITFSHVGSDITGLYSHSVRIVIILYKVKLLLSVCVVWDRFSRYVCIFDCSIIWNCNLAQQLVYIRYQRLGSIPF